MHRLRPFYYVCRFTSPINVALTGKKLTEDCKKELAEFKIDRGTNVNKNVPLGDALSLVCPCA